MRAVSLLVILFFALGCKEKEESFELNARRIAELASATCSCSDSVSNQTCAIAYGASLEANLLPQVQAGRIRLDSTRWNDCIAELSGCKIPDVCEKLFTGTVLENGECVASQECAPGLRCVPEDVTDKQCPSAGTCEEIETFERGERCDREGQCEGDDICGVASSGGSVDETDPDDDAGVDGVDDAGADDAGADAGADPVPSNGELVCRKPIEKGDPCPVKELGEEGTQLCEAGTACVPDDDELVCGDPVAAGEVCAYSVGDSTGFAPCASGNFCDPSTGTCQPFDFPEGGDIGEDCEMRSDCLPGLVCVDDECARPLPNGSECDDDDQCAAKCFDEHCAPTYVACGIK